MPSRVQRHLYEYYWATLDYAVKERKENPASSRLASLYQLVEQEREMQSQIRSAHVQRVDALYKATKESVLAKFGYLPIVKQARAAISETSTRILELEEVLREIESRLW